MMLKKVFIGLIILLPSALYLYIANKETNSDKKPSTTTEAPAANQAQQYQTPDH